MDERIVNALRAARDLIADPQHWCRGTLARDAWGEDVGPCSPRARRWCASGALIMVSRANKDELAGDHSGTGLFVEIRPMVDAEAKRLGMEGAWQWEATRIDSIVQVNDRISHDMVIKCFDRAIATAEENQS